MNFGKEFPFSQCGDGRTRLKSAFRRLRFKGIYGIKKVLLEAWGKVIGNREMCSNRGTVHM
jgi:hypothetical protein